MADFRRVCCATAIASACLVAGCSGAPTALAPGNAPAGVLITVSSGACGTGWRHPVPGLQTFQIRNISGVPVNISLTDAQGSGVYAEIDEVASGTTRPVQVDVGSGLYAFQCDANGSGIRTGPIWRVPGNVTGDRAIAPPDVSQMLSAVTSERAYIERGLATTARLTDRLLAAILAGNVASAREAWLAAHMSYESLGSAYGMFGGYDDEIDGTPFGLALGVNDPGFTGFYRVEYGLWHSQPAGELVAPARQLTRDVKSLEAANPGMLPYPQQALSDLALRTHEILEHAIRFQLSGADDFGSGTTLATTAANIAATRAQLVMLRPLLPSRYLQLPSLNNWMSRLQQLIISQQSSRGWTAAGNLGTSQRENIDAAAAQVVQLLAPIAVSFETSPIP